MNHSFITFRTQGWERYIVWVAKRCNKKHDTLTSLVSVDNVWWTEVAPSGGWTFLVASLVLGRLSLYGPQQPCSPSPWRCIHRGTGWAWREVALHSASCLRRRIFFTRSPFGVSDMPSHLQRCGLKARDFVLSHTHFPNSKAFIFQLKNIFKDLQLEFDNHSVYLNTRYNYDSNTN